MSVNPAANIDPELLAIIVCPACRAELDLTQADGSAGAVAELVCRGCGLAYPIRDDIPVLLVDEARKP
jgi:uncharacterized protein YbaR (Trm112 family)